ncbi:MAG: D-alanyl-D-alanine carboxypeptidase [Eubacteriales bacterium]|nr:D-alanyl-D-alanine carboxypeptidase [Eubacteriales bacterium]
MKKLLFLLVVFLSVPKLCFALDISAKSACLIVADSGEIIYEKKPHIKLPMASTTKMMTALVAAESGKWDETVTVSVNAQNQEGSSIYLEENERIRLSELVCGMMLNSGNDAAVATAEHISGSTELFAELMTKRANELGAINTRFENPSGLDDENHYSTAYDLAVIGSEVIKNDSLSPIIQCKEMKIENEDGDVTYLRNHNKLLWRYDGVIGVKTGFTKKSGRCLVTAASRNGVTLIAVTLSAPSDWNDHKLMLDYGFNMCEKSIELRKGERINKIQIGKDELELVAAENIEVVDVKGVKEKRELKVKTIGTIKAPVNAGEKLGVAELYQNGKLIAQTDIVAEKNVYETSNRRKSIIDTIKELFL